MEEHDKNNWYQINIFYTEKLQMVGLLKDAYNSRYTKYITTAAVAYLYNVSQGAIKFEKANGSSIEVYCGYDSVALELTSKINKILSEIVTEKIVNNPKERTVVIFSDDLKRYEETIKKLTEEYMKKRELENMKNKIYNIHHNYIEKFKSREAMKISYRLRDEAIERAKESVDENIVTELISQFEKLLKDDTNYLIQEKDNEILQLKQKIAELQQRISELEKLKKEENDDC